MIDAGGGSPPRLSFFIGTPTKRIIFVAIYLPFDIATRSQSDDAAEIV